MHAKEPSTSKAQAKAIVDSAERNLGNNDGDHVGRKHGAGPHGVMAARDDLGPVNGNARHIGDLVGQDSAVDQTHKEECHDEQPKRRALFDARPTHVNLGSSLLVLIARSGGGRVARVLAERPKPNLGRLGAEGVGGNGQRRDDADKGEHQEGRAPTHAHDQGAYDRRKDSAAKTRARKRDGNGKAALSRKPICGDKADEQTGRGDGEATRDSKQHVDLPKLAHKAHADKHRRGGDNGKGAQDAAAHLIGNMTDDERTDNAHHGGDGIGDVVLGKRDTEVAHDERLEQAHTVDKDRVARGHDDKAGGHHEPAGEELTLLGHSLLLVIC